MDIGEIRPAYMLIRRDEGHIFVEGVWEIYEECVKYLTEVLPKSLENDFSYLKTPVKIELTDNGHNYLELSVKTEDKYLCWYEYEIIEGKINIGRNDPNWYENR